MGRVFQHYLEGEKYTCNHCGTHLALVDDIGSENFDWSHGMDYLFNKVVNVATGEKEERAMTSGIHTVADIFCVNCGSLVGWKYVGVHENGQRYKIGRHVLGRCKVLGHDGSSYPIGLGMEVSGNEMDAFDY